MQQLDTNLNFISSLPDDPAMTTQNLKQEFDKAGNIIKDFINNILEAEIDSNIASCLNSAKAYADSQIGQINLSSSNISYDNTASGLSAINVQDAIDEVKGALDTAIESLSFNLSVSKASKTSSAVTLSAQERKSVSFTIAKAGYQFMSVIGTGTNDNWVKLYITDISSIGNGTVTLAGYLENGTNNVKSGITGTVNTLWGKIA